MKFSVGYSLLEHEKFISAVDSYQESISEVYFAWPHMATGRLAYGSQDGYVDWQVQAQLEQDIVSFKKKGIKLNLLFNANCYGAQAISCQLENNVTSILDHLREIAGGVDSVTTNYPFISYLIKKRAENIEIRASVNMRIGTISSMKYVAHLFDSFCIQREYNRNIDHIKMLKNWADKNKKKLTMLVNSGCLNFCPNQIFHDNLVAHEAESSQCINDKEFNPVMCWDFLSNPDNHALYLENSNWIHPENISDYASLFDTFKLATRLHNNPAKVIGAYVRQSCSGNPLKLLEPSFAKKIHM